MTSELRHCGRSILRECDDCRLLTFRKQCSCLLDGILREGGTAPEHPLKNRYLSVAMPALVIKAFPEALHAKLRQIAAAHRRSVTQETIHLIEAAIAVEERAPSASPTAQPKWANRKLLPEYEALLKSGALTSTTDSTIGLSEEHDAR
jgi:plasmid stability protein